MGMSAWYGRTDWDESVATIRRAVELGVTFLDTANVYGDGHNEVLVGRAVHGFRDQVQLASKCGIDLSGGGSRVLRGDRGYVKQACEASLLRLGVETIDLYYLHRPSENAEIEESVGAMSELVAEGKIRHLGLSEVDEDLLRRAHAVHPVTAVQSEYSIWSREPEALAPVMRELGVALVPYSPLGRGFLTGTVRRSDLGPDDFRSSNPRFTGDAGRSNETLAAAVGNVADRLGVPAAQVALAWVHSRAEALQLPVVPIPGTKRVRWLEQNIAALGLSLDEQALDALEPLAGQVAGARY